ncbi:MAG TPA: hypothetical protein PKI14_05655 [Fervidobacterium sp.]|nr:hypothetical protein [Fervidobacterium sp.]HOM74356.1 hypothetical protein [Fervidobacterium sp.]HOQ40074.1 hypothetical protein [Fervidobacterium sp.]HPT54548.1 hypothetical protein [Fervidobacterium sp.]HPZ17943.1 hypothetical protein [Fervidobacterium sp.]
MEYFDKMFKGIDEDLKREFLDIKELHDKGFQEYKDEFTDVFWKVYIAVAECITEDSPTEQKLLLRLGLVDPRYLSKDDLERIKETFSRDDSDIFYYVDEWLIAIKSGKIPPSTFEDVIQETHVQRTLDVSWLEKEYERKVFERTVEEEKLKDLVKGIQAKGPYTKGIYVIFDEVIRSVGNLKRMDNEIKNLYETIKKANEQEQNIRSDKSDAQRKPGDEGKEALFTEPQVVRQMIRKTVGKVGIQYPVLISNYLKDINQILSKRFLSGIFEEFKTIDSTTLSRSVRGANVYMPPYVVLVPGYGEQGFCWEPIEGTNIYGRGRLVVPIFSKKGTDPFFQAFGEYRWKLDKEMSFGRWMEEGLTGEYYQYLEQKQFKGNPAEPFVRDYIMWVTKEVKGIQKLEKGIRNMFWRYIPFDDRIKEGLSKVSYVYHQLWEKDLRKKSSQQK